MVWCLRWTLLPPQNDLKVKVKRSPSCRAVSSVHLNKKVIYNLRLAYKGTSVRRCCKLGYLIYLIISHTLNTNQG